MAWKGAQRVGCSVGYLPLLSTRPLIRATRHGAGSRGCRKRNRARCDSWILPEDRQRRHTPSGRSAVNSRSSAEPRHLRSRGLLCRARARRRCAQHTDGDPSLRLCQLNGGPSSSSGAGQVPLRAAGQRLDQIPVNSRSSAAIPSAVVPTAPCAESAARLRGSVI
jgi:hypothetical protein